MNRLSHPNILVFMGVCVDEGQLHALTEYINGGSLEQFVQNRAVDIPQVTRVILARDIAYGMSYLHSKGVFHRDLTSKNVLIKRLDTSLNSNLRAVVADFGLAARIPDPKSGHKLCTVGSPYWMSPECLKGKYYDERSDVFSYGIVLCEMIARVEADPDQLPRTDNFGLDYMALLDLCEPGTVVPDFLQLAFRCCTIDPKSRPTFPNIVHNLTDILTEMKLQDEQEARLHSTCATRSVEQLSGLHNNVPTVTTAQHRKIYHRRSLSDESNRATSPTLTSSTLNCSTSSYASPSEKARRHALSMCRQDPHYKPRMGNPFAALAQFRGVKKFLGNFSSCCEMPSPSPLTSDSEPTRSLPGSPTSIRKPSTAAHAHCSHYAHQQLFHTTSGSDLPNHHHHHHNSTSNSSSGTIVIGSGSGSATTATAPSSTSSSLASTATTTPSGGVPVVGGVIGCQCVVGGVVNDRVLPGDTSRVAGVTTGVGSTVMVAGGGGLRRRGSCESGFYSNVGECLSPSSLWGDSGGTAVSSLRSLEDELESTDEPLHSAAALLCCSGKRASSIYTDSSEDVSSVAGSDWTSGSGGTGVGGVGANQQQDLQPNISAIVEYFEKKGANLRHHTGANRSGHQQLSSRIAALRKSLDRPFISSGNAQQQLCVGNSVLHQHLATPHQHAIIPSIGGVPQQQQQQRNKCSRLVVCEGAVRSKLPLFDKKV